MLIVAAPMLQHIKAQLNGHPKNCIKIREAKRPLDFIGRKYNCAGEGQQQF
jgi:hypothetical protein